MNETQQWLLLARTSWRVNRVRFQQSLRDSPVVVGVMVLFLLAYVVGAFAGVWWAFSYLDSLPGAGKLIGDRLLYLLFFVLFAMLCFSVSITCYLSLFRSDQTAWLLTLPISHRVLFLWKTAEATFFASWGMVVLLLPVLIAIAAKRETDWLFVGKTALLLVPFFLLTGAIGCLLVTVAMRFLSRRALALGAIALGVGILAMGLVRMFEEKEALEVASFSMAATFQGLMGFTDFSRAAGLPSAWLANCVVSWTRPFSSAASPLMVCLLVSHGAMGVLALSWVGKGWLFLLWNRFLDHTALASQRRTLSLQRRQKEGSRLFSNRLTSGRLLTRYRPLIAVAVKDILTFFREPAQWVQFVIVFGLLGIYAASLGQMPATLDHEHELYLTAVINMMICAFAVSTLTARFVYPQFSLEGRRLWILSMSPVSLDRIILLKFVIASLLSGAVIAAISWLSGAQLQVPTADRWLFLLALFCITLGLNALAIGLGVLFPNFKESNSAKIVNGFGGTICLISSFVYIALWSGLIMWAFQEKLTPPAEDMGDEEHLTALFWPAIWLGLLISLFTLTAPLFFAAKRVKKVEFLEK